MRSPGLEPLVSVVMLSSGRLRYVGEAIESIVRQTLGDWELIVVHTSPDCTQIVREWSERDSRIFVYFHDPWVTIPQATNIAVRRAQGRYVAILDDDDAWCDIDKLRKQVAFLDSHSEYAACGGGVIAVDAEGAELYRYLKPEADSDLRKQALLASPFANSSLLFRRSAVETSGLYDETFQSSQDWEFALRLGTAGKLYNLQSWFVRYRIWPGTTSLERQRLEGEATVRIAWRYRSRYPGFVLGFHLALMHYVYAMLPRAVHGHTYALLSRIKKAVFSSRTVRARQAGQDHPQSGG